MYTKVIIQKTLDNFKLDEGVVEMLILRTLNNYGYDNGKCTPHLKRELIVKALGRHRQEDCVYATVTIPSANKSFFWDYSWNFQNCLHFIVLEYIRTAVLIASYSFLHGMSAEEKYEYIYQNYELPELNHQMLELADRLCKNIINKVKEPGYCEIQVSYHSINPYGQTNRAKHH